MSDYKTILSLDGGGIRGLISARILHEIEERTGKGIHELFDLIVGTSTGGILAIGLTHPGGPHTAKEMLELYRERGQEIFSRSLWKRATSVQGLSDERYDAEPLEEILEEMLHDAELKATRTDIVITSYNIEKRKPYFFKTTKARKYSERNHLLRHVGRATSAAPTYFEPLLLDRKQWNQEYQRRVLIDGGVFANNPSMIALSEALASGTDRNEILLCSVGTGTNNRKIHYKEAKDWGMIGWVEPVLAIMMDGMSDSAHYLGKKVLPPVAGQQRYFRYDGPLIKGSDDLDDTTRDNIDKLIALSDEIISTETQTLDNMVSQLKSRVKLRKT